MSDDLTCSRCGGPLVDASPVEIYCPNDACWEADMQRVRAAFARMRDPKDATIERLTAALAASQAREAEMREVQTRLSAACQTQDAGAVDDLRIKAFVTNASADLSAYHEAAAQWFNDRHFRVLAALSAQADGISRLTAERDAAVERAERAEHSLLSYRTGLSVPEEDTPEWHRAMERGMDYSRKVVSRGMTAEAHFTLRLNYALAAALRVLRAEAPADTGEPTKKVVNNETNDVTSLRRGEFF